MICKFYWIYAVNEWVVYFELTFINCRNYKVTGESQFDSIQQSKKIANDMQILLNLCIIIYFMNLKQKYYLSLFWKIVDSASS